MRNLRTDINESLAASAMAHAQFVGPMMGNGRLDLLMSLAALSPGNNPPESNVSATSSSMKFGVGENKKFSFSAAGLRGFK
jgi:hypothetical protein